MRSPTLLAGLIGTAAFASAIQTMEVVGNKFFGADDGKQFFIKGVAYQLVSDDPLVDTTQCQLDAALMKELGANTIRVYHVNPDSDHSGCMSVLENAGIYLLVDLDTFATYIEATGPSWDVRKYSNYTKVMDAFHQYSNTLGFFVGNENIARQEDSVVAPYLKAAARDLKSYRDSKGYRKIPVGYSAADIVQLRPMLQDYLTCGSNPSESVDFFSLNSYSWCDPSDYATSNYRQLQDYAENFPVPLFFSETGCIVPGPRLFDDQDAIFGPNMTADWSGAIVYEWISEQNQYGLIGYNPANPTETMAPATDVVDGYLRKGTPTPRHPDFSNLQQKWKTNNPTGVASSDYDANAVSTRECPTSTQGGWWEVDGNVVLPSLGQTGVVTDPPTAASTSDSAAESDGSNEEGMAGGKQHIAGVAAGLVGIMLVFAVWF